MKKSFWIIACFCIALLFADCAPAAGARHITPRENLNLAQTVTNAALETKACQKLFAKEFPDAKASAIKMYTEEVWVTMFQFDNEVIGGDYIAVVMPIVNPRRIMVNTTWAGIMVPSDLGETLIHEFFHLMDYAYGTEEQGLVTEENSQIRAKLCMDYLYARYPEARPHDWVDGRRALK